MHRDSVLLEICVDSVESAKAAQRGGAHQVELCADLLEGGITPSAGMMQEVRSRITIALQVMIRPRAGDFCYTADEFEVMKRDIRAAKDLGADGLTLGLLLPDGTVDVERTAALVELAKPLPVTFHRAFDMTANLLASLENLIRCGIRRVLTSGGVPSAEQGASRLHEIVGRAAGRIAVMVCGGVRHHNVAHILKATGTREIHANLQSPVESPMIFRNDKLGLNGAPGRDSQRFVVNEEEVRSLFEAAQSVKQTQGS
jgi:copper homeostasis protein